MTDDVALDREPFIQEPRDTRSQRVVLFQQPRDDELHTRWQLLKNVVQARAGLDPDVQSRVGRVFTSGTATTAGV